MIQTNLAAAFSTSPGAGVADLGNGRLGGFRVHCHREDLVTARVRRRRWESGCHEPHGGTIRRWLVSDKLALHVRFGMMTAAQWKAQAKVERTWVGGIQTEYTDDRTTIGSLASLVIQRPSTNLYSIVSLWNEDRGCFKAIGLAGGTERVGLV